VVEVGDILAGVRSARWQCDLDPDPQRRCCSHQKSSLYHDGRFATLRDVIEHDDTFTRLSLAEEQNIELIEYRDWPLVEQKRRNQMNPSTKDQIKGKLYELKGNIKEKAGQVTNNPKLAAEGQNETLMGKVQKKVGQVEEVFEK
jgi:uncharacterized protein YjbJ (UPF0337 family)